MKDTIKNITIAALVAGIFGFGFGVHYTKSNSQDIQHAAAALAPAAHAAAPKAQ